MSWANLLIALVKLVNLVFTYAQERKLLNAGAQQALAVLLRAQAEALEKSNVIREDIRRRNANVAATSSLPDDGFRRD